MWKIKRKKRKQVFLNSYELHEEIILKMMNRSNREKVIQSEYLPAKEVCVLNLFLFQCYTRLSAVSF